MIKTLIVDDEFNAREFLEKMLHSYFPNKFLIVGKAESVDEALTLVENYQPELVFLDIQMPKKSGFDFIKELKTINFDIIFTTAHSEYAINAIKVSALDYILKPINYIDLLDAIKKFEKKKNVSDEKDKLQVLIENMDTGNSEYKKIAFPTEYGLELIKINSILYCEASSNYCIIHCLNGKKITLSKTLKYVEELLPPEVFFRIHKSYLVNLNFVNKYFKGNDSKVELTNKTTLSVSMRKKEEFVEALVNKE